MLTLYMPWQTHAFQCVCPQTPQVRASSTAVAKHYTVCVALVARKTQRRCESKLCERSTTSPHRRSRRRVQPLLQKGYSCRLSCLKWNILRVLGRHSAVVRDMPYLGTADMAIPRLAILPVACLSRDKLSKYRWRIVVCS